MIDTVRSIARTCSFCNDRVNESEAWLCQRVSSIRDVPTVFRPAVDFCWFPCQLLLVITQLPLSPDSVTSGLSPSQFGPCVCTWGPSVFDTCTPLLWEWLRRGKSDKWLCPIFIEEALRQPNPPLHCLLISLCLTPVASLSPPFLFLSPSTSHP